MGGTLRSATYLIESAAQVEWLRKFNITHEVHGDTVTVTVRNGLLEALDDADWRRA